MEKMEIFYLVYRYTTWINRLSLATHRLFAKRNYPLSFYVKNTNGRPIEGMVFSVKTLNGKHYITREKVPFVKASDEYGLVRFSDLKGRNYRLQHEELLLKIHVKHKHSKQFSMKLKKGRYKLRKEKEVYYLIEKE